MARVRCNLCTYSNDRYCTIKKTTVALNKPRKCTDYVYDSTKSTTKEKPKSTYVPYYMLSKKNYKKYKEQQEKEVLQQVVSEKVEKLAKPDILSRFRSNVED